MTHPLFSTTTGVQGFLEPTKKGYAAINKINPQHAAFAKQLEERLGKKQMLKILNAINELHRVFETIG